MTTHENPQPEEAGEAEPKQTPPGVLITFGTDENSKFVINVQTIGGATVLEVPTVLELAVKQTRAQLGI